MTLKTKAPVIMPGVDKIKDEATRNAVTDSNKIIQTTVRDILDDLKTLTEEGDWTAGFTCGTSGTITIDSSCKTGRYVKIGNQVTVTGYFKAASVSSPVGELSITGLPFPCADADKYYAGVAVYATGLETSGTTAIMGWVDRANPAICLRRFTAGASAPMAADVKANSYFFISATYFTE